MRHLSHRFPLLVLFLFAANAQAEVLTFRSEVLPANLTATIGGDLAFPNGNGPYPVVILLHPCGGTGSRWAHNTSGPRQGIGGRRICHLHFG